MKEERWAARLKLLDKKSPIQGGADPMDSMAYHAVTENGSAASELRYRCGHFHQPRLSSPPHSFPFRGLASAFASQKLACRTQPYDFCLRPGFQNARQGSWKAPADFSWTQPSSFVAVPVAKGKEQALTFFSEAAKERNGNN